MRRILAGVAVGLAIAWTALAIWRRIPAFPDLDADAVPSIEPWPIEWAHPLTRPR